MGQGEILGFTGLGQTGGDEKSAENLNDGMIVQHMLRISVKLKPFKTRMDRESTINISYYDSESQPLTDFCVPNRLDFQILPNCCHYTACTAKRKNKLEK